MGIRIFRVSGEDEGRLRAGDHTADVDVDNTGGRQHLTVVLEAYGAITVRSAFGLLGQASQTLFDVEARTTRRASFTVTTVANGNASLTATCYVDNSPVQDINPYLIS